MRLRLANGGGMAKAMLKWREGTANGPVSMGDPRIRLPSELFVFDHAGRSEKAGALPKNCHLLPSTAILEPKNRYARCNRCVPRLLKTCPHRWAAELTTVSGANGSRGGMLQLIRRLCHGRRSTAKVSRHYTAPPRGIRGSCEALSLQPARDRVRFGLAHPSRDVKCTIA